MTVVGRNQLGANITGTYGVGLNAVRPLPLQSEYEAFCANYLELHPNTGKKSVFRDPKRLRAIALAWRTPGDYHVVAQRFGYTGTSSVSQLLKKLPKELR